MVASCDVCGLPIDGVWIDTDHPDLDDTYFLAHMTCMHRD